MPAQVHLASGNLPAQRVPIRMRQLCRMLRVPLFASLKALLITVLHCMMSRDGVQT